MERADDSKRATSDGGPVVAQRREIYAGTEVRDLLVCHRGTAVTEGHMQARHPLFLVEDLWPVPYKPLHAEVLRACHVPHNPRNRVEIGAWTMPKLGLTQATEKVGHGLLGSVRAQRLVA